MIKNFDDTLFWGTIVSFDEKEGYYNIIYEDYDSKELNKKEVAENLDITQTHSRPIFTTQDILQLKMSLDIFGPSTTTKMNIPHHPNPSFIFQHDRKETPTHHQMHLWYTSICHMGMEITVLIWNNSGYQQQKIRYTQNNSFELHNNYSSWRSHHIQTAEGIPQLHFDQLNAIANHTYIIQTDQDKEHLDPITPTSMEDTTHYTTINRIVSVKPTTCQNHETATRLGTMGEIRIQTTQFIWSTRHVFGQPMPPPKCYINRKRVNITILPFVRTYLYKDGNIQKARGTYNAAQTLWESSNISTHICQLYRTTGNLTVVLPCSTQRDDCHWCQCKQCICRDTSTHGTIIHEHWQTVLQLVDKTQREGPNFRRMGAISEICDSRTPQKPTTLGTTH